MSLDELLPAHKLASGNSTENNRAGDTRWLGRVRVVATEEQGEQEYITTVAVWADNRESFDRLLQRKMVSRHLRLQHCENAMPAVKWLYHYPNDYAAVELAQGIFKSWPIAFGELIQVEAAANEDAEAIHYLNLSEYSTPPLVEQKGLPFWEQEWISPELKGQLFAQTHPEETLNTYLVIDASLRKKVTKIFDLDTLDVPIKCLFKGKAAEELKEVAPYLIDMTLPEGAWDDKDKVPNFHKDFFSQHWAQNTGIIVRTAAPFDVLWQHTRKFTKMRMEEDQRWVFFRFWDPRTAPYYFDSIKTNPKKVAQWINIHKAKPIECLMGKVIDEEKTWCASVNKNQDNTVSGAGMPMLSADEIAGFKRYRRDQWVKEKIAYFSEKAPFHHRTLGDDGLRKTLYLGINKAAHYGINQDAPLTLYIQVMLYLGSYFDSDPLHPWAQAILNAQVVEQADKANQLRQGLFDYLQTTCGEQGDYLQHFIRYCQQQTIALKHSDEELFLSIKQHYPEKIRYIGDTALRELLEDSRCLCEQHHLVEASSIFHLSCIRLMFGSKMMSDPLFPWLVAIFTDDHIANPKDIQFTQAVNQFYQQIIDDIEGVL